MKFLFVVIAFLCTRCTIQGASARYEIVVSPSASGYAPELNEVDRELDILARRLSNYGVISSNNSLLRIVQSKFVKLKMFDGPFICQLPQAPNILVAGCTDDRRVQVAKAECFAHTAWIHEMTHLVACFVNLPSEQTIAGRVVDTLNCDPDHEQTALWLAAAEAESEASDVCQ